jgi:hypothetical protein
MLIDRIIDSMRLLDSIGSMERRKTGVAKRRDIQKSRPMEIHSGSVGEAFGGVVGDKRVAA